MAFLRRWPVLLVSVVLVLLAAAARAAAPPADVPEALRPWIPWVLHDFQQARCPRLAADQSIQCAWPARLRLDLDASGGRFEQEWSVFAPTWVPLPGDEAHFPQDLTLDGRPGVMAAPNGRPGAWLETGVHRLTGRFTWTEMPESLTVPAATGLVSLRLNGAEVRQPARDGSGALWLAPRTSGPAEADALTLSVHRLLDDDIPLQLRTRLLLEVSGRSREVVLGPVFGAEFVPLALETTLPARLEDDGRLRLQVRPGTWVVHVTARHEGPADSLSPPLAAAPWPADEIWAVQSHPDLRVVSIEGVPSIDPQQTTLPGEWRHLPSFVVRSGETLRLVQRGRGDEAPQPDELSLQRDIWLDQDGGGFTLRDQLFAVLRTSWRLEQEQPFELGRVVIGGADQLVTTGESGRPGFEVRQGNVLVVTESRIEGQRRTLPAAGWGQDLQMASAMLHLPPGWRLFHVSGVDRAPGTWIAQWNLLDIFLALIITVSATRLWGRRLGALALVTMALTLHEPGAVRWTWLVAMALEAVLRLLPSDRAPAVRSIARATRLATLGVLAVFAVPFLIDQARTALHPQLGFAAAAQVERRSYAGAPAAPGEASGAGYFEGDTVYSSGAFDRAAENPMGEPGRMNAPTLAPPFDVKARMRIELQAAKASRPAAPVQVRKAWQHDPSVATQTGPGLPSWSWLQMGLSWSGPVERSQSLRLWLVPPSVNFLLGFLRVALVALLFLRLLLPLGARFPPWPRRAPVAGLAGSALLVLATLLGSALVATPAAAQDSIPRQDLLDQLRARLLEPPPCAPRCISVPRLTLDADLQSIALRLEVAAVAEATLQLPGGGAWRPATVTLDGRPAESLLATADGGTWMLVPQGLHDVVLSGPAPDTQSVQIPLGSSVARVLARVSGWSVSGIDEDGRPDGALLLSRSARREGPVAPSVLAPGALPPLVRVTRTLVLDITWTVDVTVERVIGTTGALSLEIPLLPGEDVTSADVRVVSGKAQVNMAPGVTSVTWRSTLAESAVIELTAPLTHDWLETWRLSAAPRWHVEASGIPAIHVASPPVLREPEWRPWPGETVSLKITRPPAQAGATLTVDASQLHFLPGPRVTEASLGFSLRASRGGEHSVTLPEGAELQSLELNGRSQPPRQDGRRVTFPVSPGAQSVALRWRESRGTSWRLRTSDVDLGTPSVNANVNVRMQAGRWVLLTLGPRQGPAVLFWSLLVVLVLVALLLGRSGLTQLRTHDWLLLLVGLSQVPVPMGAVVIAWLLALGARERYLAGERPFAFDMAQVALVLLTIVALACLFTAIRQGLLGEPRMQVVGNGSDASSLNWYQDRASGPLPTATVVSLPLMAYRLAMLAWSLWLASALLSWMRWAWRAFTTGSAWKRLRKPRSEAPPETTPTRNDPALP